MTINTFLTLHIIKVVYLPPSDPSVRLQIPHNSVITRKQLAATAYSSLVVADCLHVRTFGIEAKAKIFFLVYTWHIEV